MTIIMKKAGTCVALSLKQKEVFDEINKYIFLNCLPTLSSSSIIQQIKGDIGEILREEFE